MAQGDVLGFIKNRPGNLFINGAFEINQRFGGGINAVPSSYGLDRWFDSSGATSQRIAVANEKFQFVRQSVSTASSNSTLQRIESSTIKHLRGKKVTFSVLLKLISGALGTLPSISVNYADVKDDFSSTTNVLSDTLDSDSPIDATFKKFKKTFLVTNEMADNGFHVQFGDFGSATNSIQMTQTMLNEGENAPEFERAGVNFANEFKLCQRYFEHSYTSGRSAPYASFVGSHFTYVSPKRSIPVLSYIGGGATVGVTFNAFFSGNEYGVAVQFSSGGGGYWFNVKMSADAEL